MDSRNAPTCAVQWTPKNIITFLNGANKMKYVCLILNREIRVPPDVVRTIWENSQLRCLVDGGANRWRRFLDEHCKDKVMKEPDLITGDFDSVKEETLKHFKATKRVHTPDQNLTDFTKAVNEVRPFLDENHIENVIVFQDTSGRFDQIMANVNTLFKFKCSKLNIYLMSGNSLTWLLRPGKHVIHIPTELVEQKRWCSLMPIGAPARNVTTKGLRWDLCNDVMEFGGLVSTSNTYASEIVHIETANFLIWSMGLFCFDDSC